MKNQIHSSNRGRRPSSSNRRSQQARSKQISGVCAEIIEQRLLLSAYTVNTTSDATNPGLGLLTLRQAVTDANNNPGADTIAFDPTVFTPGTLHTITLTQGQLEFTDTTGTTTVTGPGSPVLAISGGGASRVLEIDSGVTVAISGLQIINGKQTTADSNPNTYGGGILNAGALTITDSVISGNQVVGSGTYAYDGRTTAGNTFGGGIYSTDSLTITGSTLSNNTVTNLATDIVDSDLTGGAAQDGGTAAGGAIYSASIVPVTLNNDTITGNSASASSDFNGVTYLQYADGGPAAGGGVYASAALTVSNSSITGNTTTAGDASSYGSGNGGNGSGGGIFAGGLLTMTGSIVENNTLNSGRSSFDGGYSGVAHGGGLDAEGGASISSTTISSNNITAGDAGFSDGVSAGGGLYAPFGATLNSDTINGNNILGGPGAPTRDTQGSNITTSGGGIFGGDLNINDSSITGNTITSRLQVKSGYAVGGHNVGGGITSTGMSTITNSTVSGNSVVGGHGLYAYANYQTTYGGNADGGGIFNTGPLTITNSTIAANHATGGAGADADSSANLPGQPGGNANGGAIFTSQNLTIYDSTITGNNATGGRGGAAFYYNNQVYQPAGPAGTSTAGGIDITAGLTLLDNSIVSANTTIGENDIHGNASPASASNLIGVGGGLTNGAGGNKVGINNPQLSPLGDFGGPTQTMPPLPGSAAIDAGNNSDVSPFDITTDQRGLPRIFDGTVDIGAVESQPIGTKLTGAIIGTTGSYRSQGNTSSKALDGNLTTFFDAPDASGDWVGLDLGSVKQITSISFAPRSGLESRMVGGMFQASNSADFSSGVVTLFTVTSTPQSGKLTTVAIDNPNAFRYVRYIGPANGYCNITEAQFFGNALVQGAVLTPSGALIVNGSANADTITLSVESQDSPTPDITAVVDGVSQTFSLAAVLQVVINAGAGNDTVTLNGFDEGPNDSTGHGYEAITVNGDEGDDTLTNNIQSPEILLIDGGAGNDTIFNGGFGAATIIGGDGNDLLKSSGYPGLVESIYGGDGDDTVIADGDTTLAVYDGGAGSNTLDLSENPTPASWVSDIKLNLYVNVHNLILGGLTDETVIGTSGNDTITGDAGDRNVSIVGGGGDDTVNITGGQTVYVDASADGPSNITVTNAQFVTVIGGAGNDTINVRGNTHANVNGGPGTDTAYTDPGDTVINVEILNPDITAKLTGAIIGTPGSYKNDGNTSAKAFDGNLTTFFDAPDASGDWAGLDLGSAKIITQISFAPRSGWESRMVGGMFQASNSADFSSGVVTLYTVAAAPLAGALTTVAINNQSAYRYLRYIGPANGYCNIAEVEFIGNTPVQGASLTNDGTLVVNGSANADNITVDLAGFGAATVTIDGVIQSFFGGVAALVVNAGAGNDTVLVDGNDVGITDSSIVPVTINGGDGNDSLTTHIFTPAGTPINQVYLDGGAGNDYLNVQNDGVATLIGGDGDDTFDSNGNPNTLLESVYGGDGNDTLLADGNTGYSIYDGGAGSNTIDYNTNGPASSPPGLTTLNLSGSFLVNVNTVIATDLITHIVANDAGDTITYPDAGEDSVTITGGAGNDTITVNSADGNPINPVVINGNGGDDTITVTNSQNVSINGGAGNDTIHARGDDAVFIDGGPGTDTAYTDPDATVINVEILNPDQATKVSGTLFNDANKNGKQDSNESGLSGWTVFGDLNNNGKLDPGEASTTTGPTGQFLFSALLPGAYIFRVLPPPGWTQTFPTNNFGQHVTLSAGGSITNINFGFAQTAVPASISGSVFNDANGNGIQNSGELGLSGWTVFIDLTNSGTLQNADPTTTTDSTGDFTFTNLTAGTYILRVISPTGWSQTLPTKNFGQHINLASGQKVNAVLFGEKKL